MSVIDWQALPATAEDFRKLYGDAPVIHPDDRDDIRAALLEKAQIETEWYVIYTAVCNGISDDERDEAEDDEEWFNALLQQEPPCEDNLVQLHALFNECYLCCEQLEDYVYYMCEEDDIYKYSKSTQLDFASDLDLIMYAVRNKEITLAADVVADAAIISREIKERFPTRKRQKDKKEPPAKRVFIDLSKEE